MSVRRERMILIAAFALHVAITLWTSLHHEVWSDEGDLWLLARDAPLSDMLISASNGGVPLLFHLTVLPFARSGLPYVAMQLLNLVYVWLAVALFLRSRAFALPVKILFAFSYFPAFEYAAIPRPYSLQMLLTFSMAALWRDRTTHPYRLGIVVALLANTSSHGLITAAVAGALLLFERLRSRLLRDPRIIGATFLTLCGGLLAVAQLWPREGRQHVYTWVSVDTVWYAVASMFFPDVRIESVLMPALLVLGIVTYAISRSWLATAFLWITGSSLVVVFVFVWMGGIRHAGLLLILALSAVWIADSYAPYRHERLLMAALAVSLAWSIVPAWSSWVQETKYAFSGSREVARFLRESGASRDATLVSHAMFWRSPLVYLPESKICHPAEARCSTYGLWQRRDFELSKIPLERLLELAHARYANTRWLFLTHHPLPAALRSQYRLRFETGVTIWRQRSERYYVYEPVGAVRRDPSMAANRRSPMTVPITLTPSHGGR